MNLSVFLKLLEEIAPIALAATPLAPIAPFVAFGIKTAEGIKGATGEQKLVIAKALVDASVAGANAQAGRQVVDPATVSALSTSAINTVVAAINVKNAQNALPPAPPPPATLSVK